MKLILIIISIATFCQWTIPSTASAKKNIQKVSKKINTRTTDAHFSGANIHGKYSHSPESVVTVENEKNLISVVKPRSKLHFQIKKSLEELK
jgi:hypothetical protein